MFYIDSYTLDGYDKYCKACRAKYRATHKAEAKAYNKKYARRNQLKHQYGMSIVDYKLLLKKQENKCAICSTHKNKLDRILCVDHNHQTGLVRGLLCYKCNAALGAFKDNVSIIKRAIKYLEKN